MAIPKSDFSYFLQELNGFAGDFSHWHFQPGMLFAENQAWWQPGRRRPAPHEGVDFRGYVNLAGETVCFNGRAKVPSLYEGEIAGIFDDFLGRSLLIGHAHFEAGKRLYSLYAHLRPREGCWLGARVRAGQWIATIAPAKGKKVPAHLHLSTLLMPESAVEALSWRTINHQPAVVLRNPAHFLELGVWYVYMVRCADNSLYSGITTDLSRRLTEHNAAKGGARYTRARQPVTLHYYELAGNRAAAAKRELALKKMRHGRKIALAT